MAIEPTVRTRECIGVGVTDDELSEARCEGGRGLLATGVGAEGRRCWLQLPFSTGRAL
jgi:hypothetical protein